MQSAGRNFIEFTKYKYASESDQNKGMVKPPDEPDLSSYVKIKLEEGFPEEFNHISLKEAIERRRSIRKYSGEPLGFSELSALLWATQGNTVAKGDRIYKNVPSAGGRHALDTYLLVNDVESLKPGLYRYFSSGSVLVKQDVSPDIRDRITDASKGYTFTGQSTVTFIWVADIYRMTYRHGERGYRFVFLDAGHICQNLYLAAEAINCGVCAVAVYDDDLLNNALNIDGEDKFVVYMAAAGKKYK